MGCFWFAIPLRSAGASLDWARVTRLLEATVGSALNSRDAVVRVVIACNEVPDIAQAADPRVTFLPKHYPVPETSAHQMLDKRFKKFDLTKYIINEGGGYMMLLDSDDFVHRDLAKYVIRDDNRSGYTIKTGYILDAESEEIERVSDFDSRCGSSTIIYLDGEDESCSFNWPLYITVTQHQDFARLSKHTPRQFGTVSYPAAIALKNNGENHSYRFRGKGKKSVRTRIVNALRGRKSEAVSLETIEQFGLK